ncbi:hypothetical protein KUH03_14025 [Sphingobacterium sp. E70]|uniref:hypothetical protein n=1 Tax=Sphingobacterium sp. E70 TaxID=2853439 RepID=UPI00211CAF27|nr:hypothetical protein [Sphingobacterium sp. E70]ULT27702.1 hypothetical protein KUH03_14025 [Sphingobacterium sp. E70]
MNSYVHDTPGYENIDLLEDSIVYQIDQKQLFALYESDIAIANWGRKMAELEFIKAEQRTMSKLLIRPRNGMPSCSKNIPNIYSGSSLVTSPHT